MNLRHSLLVVCAAISSQLTPMRAAEAVVNVNAKKPGAVTSDVKQAARRAKEAAEAQAKADLAAARQAQVAAAEAAVQAAEAKPAAPAAE